MNADGREIESFAALVQNLGAKAVLATLWPVADVTTPQLMESFYRGRRDNRSKVEALRQAQLSFIHGNDLEHRHPYHWAAFILAGNWR